MQITEFPWPSGTPWGMFHVFNESLRLDVFLQKYLSGNCRAIFEHLHLGMELTLMMAALMFPIILEWNRCRRGTPKMVAGLVGL